TLTLVDGRRRVSRSAQRDDLGDYHLYRLPWSTDLGSRQSKQVLFMDKGEVRIERFYSVYRYMLTDLANQQVLTPDLAIRWENTERAGLGEPLARGTVRVFEPYAGREVFAGEARIDDRPVGLPVELRISRALNVMLEVTTGLARSGPSNRTRTTVTADYRIVNNKSVPIDLEIRHSVESRYRNLQIEESSRPAGRKYGDPAWRFTVRPGEDTLRYRLSARESAEWPRTRLRIAVSAWTGAATQVRSEAGECLAMEINMTLYVITRVCVDADGWLEEATGREAEGSYNRLVGPECQVPAAEVLRAIDGDDSIELIATGPGGTVSAISMLVCEETPQGRKLRLRQQDEDAQHRIELYTL